VRPLCGWKRRDQLAIVATSKVPSYAASLERSPSLMHVRGGLSSYPAWGMSTLAFVAH
jgi:hypothetical protein